MDKMLERQFLYIMDNGCPCCSERGYINIAARSTVQYSVCIYRSRDGGRYIEHEFNSDGDSDYGEYMYAYCYECGEELYNYETATWNPDCMALFGRISEDWEMLGRFVHGCYDDFKFFGGEDDQNACLFLEYQYADQMPNYVESLKWLGTYKGYPPPHPDLINEV